jgi:type IV pilus assembly protein PilA
MFMKTFLKSFKERQSGFTLVELMVVVAIIGLLSSVALPNFRKYQAKSKMSEAKLQLSALYTAQSAFFSDYNMYASCLAYMGYDPSTEQASRYYAIGWETHAIAIATAAWDSAVNSGMQTGTVAKTVCTNSAAATDGANWFRAGKGTGAVIASTVDFLDSSMLGTQATNSDNLETTGMTYRVAAGGVIEGTNSTESTASLVTIDNRKRVLVFRNGY